MSDATESAVSRPRRVIMVAFHYLPDNTSTGVLRTLKFTDYLRGYGWTPEVVSVPDHLYVRTDPSSLDRIPPGVSVHRPWAADVKQAIAIRGVYPDWVTIPDRYWPWVLTGTRCVRRLAREADVRAIYTTFPPASALLIGLRAKRATGLPWVADFRDPWVENSMPWLRRKVEGKLERIILEEADRVICNTPAMRRWFLQRNPDLPGEKFVTITNGYDETDLAGVVPETKPEFEILYPGMISPGNRNPGPLLEGIRIAVERGWLPKQGMRVTFLGTGRYGESDTFRRQLQDSGVAHLAEVVTERIPYPRALARMAGADVLVVLSEPLGDSPEARAEREWSHLQVPAKVYEYLRLGRPLLALVTGGAVAELLNATGGGSPISPYEPEEIAAYLAERYRQYAQRPDSSRLADNPGEAVTRHSREHLTGMLANLLDELTEGQRGTSLS